MVMIPTGKKILIVDDEASILAPLTSKLVGEGFSVLQAHNGQEGLEVALREHPDLILLDIMMPVMDGNTMHAQLLKDTWGRNAEVIFLTNVADSQQWATVFGKPQYLVKTSWSLADVVQVVKNTLGIVEEPISSKDKMVTVK
jgi:CheY-like chemotaxis protein